MGATASPSDDALQDLSLREAAQAYDAELTTLRDLVRRGRLDAFKAPGPWGREWRVTRLALEAEGYRPRSSDAGAGWGDERIASLQRELAVARRSAAAERRRAEEADRRLGEALMEAGRLRAALAVPDGDGDRKAVSAVDMGSLRDVLVHLRGGGAATAAP